MAGCGPELSWMSMALRSWSSSAGSKQAFDPLGIFNPGIILPSGEPPIGRLKVGSSAVPIPADLQRALREIELTGGYGRSRLELA